MKRFLFLVFLLVLIPRLWSAPVNRETAQGIAARWYQSRSPAAVRTIEIDKVIVKDYNGHPSFYICTFKSGGFVIVSGDDATIPILGYSFDSPIDEQITNPALRDWLEGYHKQVDYVISRKLNNSKTIQIWRDILAGNSSIYRTKLEVPPLLATRWNQGWPYNELCPTDPDGPRGHVWAGCGAAAMAQVMKYWNHPTKGFGSLCYSTNYGQLCVSFSNAAYDWVNMPNSISTSNLAVATLLYHCGVAQKMIYGPSESGSGFIPIGSALINFFDYAPSLKCIAKSNYATVEWEDLLRNELDQARPIAYSGGTHLFVCDGYQATDYFHFNWGWSGAYDGYYYLSSLNPAGYDFSSGQQAIVGIEPGGFVNHNWISQTSGITTDLNSVFFVDAYIGWVAGRGGTILKTIDGGTTWTQQGSGTANDLSAIYFVNANTGYAVGRDRTIRRTTDGGMTWAQQTSDATWNLTSICFANADTGWISEDDGMGTRGGILRTTDGGNSWTRQYSSSSVGFLSICFITPSTGWAVGGYYFNGGTILKTTNGGWDWVTQFAGGGPGFLSIDFCGVDTGWAVGCYGEMLGTTNGGSIWTQYPSGCSPNWLHSLHVARTRTGTTVGDGGYIISTQDGGATWSAEPSGTIHDLRSVCFASANSGWAVGSFGTILKYSPQQPFDNIPICVASGDQSEPSITNDGGGGAIIAWTDLRNGRGDIYAQRLNASHVPQWQANGLVIRDEGYAMQPLIVSDGVGGAIVTWPDNRSGDQDVYAQRVDGQGVVQWTTNGIAISKASNGQFVRSILNDGAGGAIIAWEDNRLSPVWYDIYVQRVSASGVVQWTQDGVAICTDDNNQLYPQLVSDGLGGAIIVWEDHRSGIDSKDIYGQRIDASGGVRWAQNGVAVCTAPNSQCFPKLDRDGFGGAIVTWHDYRGGTGNAEIYAQRINSSGVVQWTADGVAICTALNDQIYPTLTADGSAGGIITWEDYRSGTNNADIYAQRISNSGAVQWTGNGVAICAAEGNQLSPTISNDGLGGATIAWSDARTGIGHTYAQRINSSGIVYWERNGIPVSTSPSYQPRMASDGMGGAFITWTGPRNPSSYDIYAQWVGDEGALPVQLAMFTGRIVDAHAVLLEWTTLSETNNYGFEVQRKGSTRSQFETLDNSFIAGQGTTVNPHRYSYIDRAVPAGQWQYRLRQIDLDGAVHYTNVVSVDVLTSVGEKELPKEYALQQNYPNPFNPSTTIKYELPERAEVVLNIFNTLGQQVATLVQGETEAGYHQVKFDATGLASGVYLYRLQAGHFVQTRKLVLLR